MYTTPHLKQLKLQKSQPPMKIFESATSGSGGDADVSLWLGVHLQVSQSLAMRRRAQNVLGSSGGSQVSLGHEGFYFLQPVQGLAFQGGLLELVGAVALRVRSWRRDSSALPRLWRGPRLPHICVLSEPAAGSCSLSLYPLMDGSVSL